MGFVAVAVADMSVARSVQEEQHLAQLLTVRKMKTDILKYVPRAASIADRLAGSAIAQIRYTANITQRVCVGAKLGDLTNANDWRTCVDTIAEVAEAFTRIKTGQWTACRALTATVERNVRDDSPEKTEYSRISNSLSLRLQGVSKTLDL